MNNRKRLLKKYVKTRLSLGKKLLSVGGWIIFAAHFLPVTLLVIIFVGTGIVRGVDMLLGVVSVLRTYGFVMGSGLDIRGILICLPFVYMYAVICPSIYVRARGKTIRPSVVWCHRVVLYCCVGIYIWALLWPHHIGIMFWYVGHRVFGIGLILITIGMHFVSVGHQSSKIDYQIQQQ